jgi:toxin ParE1/3/4
MTARINRRPAAEADLTDHASHIAQDSVDAAERFLKSAEDAFSQLAICPYLGRPWTSGRPRLKGLRIWRIPGFRNYLVFYRVTRDAVEIVRVMHGAQDLEASFGG